MHTQETLMTKQFIWYLCGAKDMIP